MTVSEKYIIALDLGTSSVRALLVNSKKKIVGFEQKSFKQYYPQNGWVEQDAEEIYKKIVSATNLLIQKHKVNLNKIAGIGITNQRETTILWGKKTGKPIYKAIVWQDKRTSSYCENLKKDNYSKLIRDKTGLVIDPYFSATKIKWIFDNVKPNPKDILFGTVDSWILWKLSGGKTHATDYSNASRTMCFNINKLEWDDELLKLFAIPRNILPEIKPSSSLFGYTHKDIFGKEIPILSMIGDQQSALFGQKRYEKGDAKITYGTGCFMLMNIGEKPKFSSKGLLTTIAWGLDNKVFYALEGSVFDCASVINWLINDLNLAKSPAELDKLASTAKEDNGVTFISAFSGLGVPYWNSKIKASINGLTLSSNKAHIARAALESIAYQVKDVMEVMQEESALKVNNIKVDGGVSNSKFLMQFQSDILQAKILKSKEAEMTALGAAYMAGLTCGLWKLKDFKQDKCHTFKPKIPISKSDTLYKNWKEQINGQITIN